jgi:Fe-S-cluster-containing hydrogenase component 2
LKKCPTGAISGQKKGVHTIDVGKCIKCGACLEVCKFDAVSKQSGEGRKQKNERVIER